jgi:putative glutamine amidotransferase
MRKPIIGISGSIMILENGRFPGYRRSYVNEDYVKAVTAAGGIPVILPMLSDKSVIDHYIQSIDALVLSGGHDVEPMYYGEQPLQKIGRTLPERDDYDIMLIERAMEKEIPILGICRGMQIMNVAFGGSLYQDLDYIPECNLRHDQYSDPSLATHEVAVTSGSKLHGILRQDRIRTNSFHHLAVKELAKPFKVVAKADDGVVEAVEHRDYPFAIGVQWHPEMMALNDDNMMKLFKALIQASDK